MPPQKIPRINPARVPIQPIELNSVASHSMGAGRPRWRLIHLQQLRSSRLRLTRLAMLLLPLFHTGSAGAGIAQPGEVPLAVMPVFPVNLHASAFGLKDAHFGRRQRLFGKAARAMVFAILAFLFFFAEKANSLVAHASILPAQQRTILALTHGFSRRSKPPCPGR